MNNTELLKELGDLLSGKTMKRLSGKPKKCYKYALVSVFLNICSGRMFTNEQEINFEYVYSIKNTPKQYNNDNVLKNIKSIVVDSLKNSYFYDYDNYETINKTIDFFREIISDTKKHGTYLVRVSRFEEIFDIKEYFKNTHENLQSHHLVEFNITKGMIITIPEFFTYSDVINGWNMYIDKLNEYNDILCKEDGVSLNEKINNIYNRQLKYEIDFLGRTLWVGSVTFVESYLYYLFYNLKQINYTPQSKSGKSIMELQQVEDEELIKRLIIPEFIQEKNTKLTNLIKEYRKINRIRNRFIHPSAFQNQEGRSELLSLITVESNEIAHSLEICKKLAKTIDESLPKEFQILFWWDRVIHPDFKSYVKGRMINPESMIDTIK